MSAARRILGLAGRALLLTLVVALTAPQGLEAQIGLTSGLAQVYLVARVTPQGSIQAVAPGRETAREAGVAEVSMTVRLTANTGYRLMAIRTDAVSGLGRAPRLWVRDASGQWQALTSGSRTVVAQGGHAAGDREHDVRYRIETNERGAAQDVPVRYEILIDPKI